MAGEIGPHMRSNNCKHRHVAEVSVRLANRKTGSASKVLQHMSAIAGRSAAKGTRCSLPASCVQPERPKLLDFARGGFATITSPVRARSPG